MKISIIIPNYNGEALLKENLPYVIKAAENYFREKKGVVEIIIVDDFSTDKSVTQIRSFISNNSFTEIKIKILENKNNLGFSSTVNKGVEAADGKIIVLLNTDIKPKLDFLTPLIFNFENEKMFAVGCTDESVEKDKIILRGRGVGEWKRGFLIHRKGEVDRSNTLWVSGGSGAFKKEIWNKLKGLDELYSPFYWEDIDLSYRGLKSGYQTKYERESVVIHEHTKGAINSKYSKNYITKIAYRNQFIFFWKNVTDIDLWIKHFFWMPYHLIKALLRGDLAFFNGFFNALILLPKIIQSRSRAKKLFVKGDHEIINHK